MALQIYIPILLKKGISLLKPGGIFGYIVANKWMRTNYGEPLRRWLKIKIFSKLPILVIYQCLKMSQLTLAFYVLGRMKPVMKPG